MPNSLLILADSLVVLTAGAAAYYSLWMIKAERRVLAGDAGTRSEKAGTHWLRAIFSGILIAVVFGDPIIVHNVTLALWGEASLFFAVFFIQIFLDQRTRLRGIMALGASLSLSAFYLVYSTAPQAIR